MEAAINPTGPYRPVDKLDKSARQVAIKAIADTPGAMRAAVAGLTDAQLDTTYREGGWTVRQVVHHTADSHINAFVRFKLMVTEDNPTIKPYDQDAWANCGDSVTLPVEPSLAILDGLHQRWVTLLNSLGDSDFSRTLVHPEEGKSLSFDRMLSLYAWHGPHHVAQITSLRARKGW